jgi:hypothetical protein
MIIYQCARSIAGAHNTTLKAYIEMRSESCPERDIAIYFVAMMEHA